MLKELNVQGLGRVMTAKDFLQDDVSNMMPTKEVEVVLLQYPSNKDTDYAIKTGI